MSGGCFKKEKAVLGKAIFSSRDSSLPVLVSTVVLLDAAQELEKKMGELFERLILKDRICARWV